MRYVLLLLLAGCAAQWVHPSKSERELYTDDYECAQRATALVPIREAPLDNTRERLWASCMRAKGWRQGG